MNVNIIIYKYNDNEMNWTTSIWNSRKNETQMKWKWKQRETKN